MPAIEVQDLKKYYGDTRAVDGVSFAIEQGEVFGMLGPNGAGKTTTTEIIEGLRLPDSGTVRVLGLALPQNTRRVKGLIGVQLQTTALYPRLTVREVLDLFSSFFPGEKRSTDTLIDMVNLHEKEKALSKDLSGGQRQRLSVALALINKPHIVFLDEPTTGLDPQARRSMWETIREVQKSGATVFLTTHYMEEAQELCDRVAVVDAGKIIALDTPNTLISQHFKESVIEFQLTGEAPPEGTFRKLKGVTRPGIRENGKVTMYTTDSTATLGGLTDLAEAGTVKFDSLYVRRATLEDVFLKLTGKHIRE
ncbi:ABC transporter ATP-binding protein [Candidatus Acetothermia bacterium]|nr:ABC transporter ATP-binding protein [Candidatus Acetothermia bacterium]MBI3659441.1 ABC transporter ATP-binding protein [Candidatus Acetothermia bacterium]